MCDDPLAQLLGRHGGIERPRPRSDHDESPFTVSRDNVEREGRRPQGVGNLNENTIANGVNMGVVHGPGVGNTPEDEC